MIKISVNVLKDSFRVNNNVFLVLLGVKIVKILIIIAYNAERVKNIQKK